MIREKIEDMQIGDKIICDYYSNEAGTVEGSSFNNLGNYKKIDYPFIDPKNVPRYIQTDYNEYNKGRFYFVMIGWDFKGRRILVADRMIQSYISYEQLNDEGFIFGKRQNTFLLKDDITKQKYIIDNGNYMGRDNCFEDKHGYHGSSCWEAKTASPPAWVGQNFPEPKKICGYSIAIILDGYFERSPIEWTLEGSNDGEHWKVLAYEKNKAKAKSMKKRYFEVPQENQGYYTHYRLNWLEFYGATLISEIEMFEESEESKKYNFYVRSLKSSINGLVDEYNSLLSNSVMDWNKSDFYNIISTTAEEIDKRIIYNKDEKGYITTTKNEWTGFRPLLLVEERDIKRYLIYKDGKYKSILKDGNIIDVQIDSFEDFKEKGMSNLENLFISTGVNRPIDVLGDKFEIKAISKENLKLKIKTPPIKAIDKLQNKDITILQKAKDNIDKFVEIKGKPKPQIVIPKEDIDISSVESVDKINIKTLGKGGNIKLAISGDSGQRWVVNNSGSWQEIELKDIKDAGMDIKRLSSLTKEELAIILKNNTLRIAYYIEYDDVQSDYGIDNLQMQVDMRGVWQKARHYTDYDYEYASNTKLRVYIKRNGTYKINYPS